MKEELLKKEVKKFYNNIDSLINIIAMDIDEFCAYGFSHATEDNRKFYFMDNEADILAVAHLDTVQQTVKFSMDKKNGLIHSPQLDDRLGAYIILEHLLRDMNYDVLLTIDEEKGRSTARSFNNGKKYNWMFSFDRRGTDAVMYQYESPEMIEV